MRELPPSFGNVTEEYLSLRDEHAVTAGWHRLIWVSGSDTVSFLQGLLSQDVDAARAGDVASTLLLQPNGKLHAIAWMLKGTDEVGLLVDAGLAESVATTLVRYRIRVDAAVEVDERPVLEMWGKSAGTALASQGLPVPAGWTRTADGVVVVAAPLGALPRFFVVGQDLVGTRAGSQAATAVRVEAGEPVMGRDLNESTIPQESGLVDRSVSFTKGCYLGQELVSRIDTRGHVNRRLMGVVVGDNVIPPEGASLHADGREVGVLTSPAESLTLRAPIALSLIRREVEPGEDVTIRWEGGHATARVEALPLSRFSE